MNVASGDTLESLAEMYQMPYEKLLAANKGMHLYAVQLNFPSLHLIFTPSAGCIRNNQGLIARTKDGMYHMAGISLVPLLLNVLGRSSIARICRGMLDQ